LKQARAENGRKLFLSFFAGSGGLCGVRFSEALLEFIDAPGCIDELLHAGVEGMADIADPDQDGGPRRAGFYNVPAGATQLGIHVFRMSVSFHKSKGGQTTNQASLDKREMACSKTALLETGAQHNTAWAQ
jgi:hypothetical protein